MPDIEEKSLREEIEAAYEAAATPEVEEKPAGEQQESSRARDEHGRFAAKTAEAADLTATEIAAATAAPAELVVEQIAPPPNFKAEFKDKWDKWDVEARKYILAREDEVHKGFTKIDEERQFAKSIRDVVAPYAAMIQAENSTPAQAVQSLLNTAYILRSGTPQQRVAALQSIAQQYQIPLEQVQQQQRLDPQVQHLQSQLAEMQRQQQLAAMTQQQREQEELNTTIAAFAASPGHDHFEQVKPHMAALLSNGLAKDMQDAYDQAVWARPDLRATVLAAQQQTAEAEARKQAQARAAAANRAAGSVSGAPGTAAPVKAPERSLREELEANFAAAR